MNQKRFMVNTKFENNIHVRKHVHETILRVGGITRARTRVIADGSHGAKTLEPFANLGQKQARHATHIRVRSSELLYD